MKVNGKITMRMAKENLSMLSGTPMKEIGLGIKLKEKESTRVCKLVEFILGIGIMIYNTGRVTNLGLMDHPLKGSSNLEKKEV